MNRKKALSHIGLILGGTIVGSQAFLTGCSNGPDKISGALDFSPKNISFLDEVGETILPTTASSPGAKETMIGDFMKTIVTDCYEVKNQEIFMEGIGKLNKAAKDKFGSVFVDLEPAKRHELLVAIDKEASEYKKAKKDTDPEHYFTLMKQLTLWGYFTSKPGATKALRYVPVPGRYEGCIDYKKGDKAWAL